MGSSDRIGGAVSPPTLDGLEGGGHYGDVRAGEERGESCITVTWDVASEKVACVMRAVNAQAEIPIVGGMS